MSNLRNWFLGMRVWLCEQQVLWATVAVLIVAGLYVWFWPAASGDDRLRYVGTFLQVLGIATVWVGFEKTRKLFGYEYTVVAFWRWVGRIPYRAQRRDVTVQLSGQAMVITGGTANLSVGTTGTSVEARLVRVGTKCESHGGAVYQRDRGPGHEIGGSQTGSLTRQRGSQGQHCPSRRQAIGSANVLPTQSCR